MSTSKKITLMSSDGEIFEVEEMVLMEVGTIKRMIEDGCADGKIPLPNVTSKILSKVLKYCKKHAEGKDGDDAENLKSFDFEFMNVDMDTLHDLLVAANYLDAKNLLELGCKTVADIIRGKTPEEIREKFNIENDFTPEEEEEVKKENSWAFE